MRGLGILILIVMFFWLVWPIISRWLKRKAMERAEDYMRASMGMPPRDKHRKSYKKQEQNFSGRDYGTGQGNPYTSQSEKEPLIPREYAEDVEFVETKEYSSTTIETHSKGKTKIYHESQISDVEWIEIKTKK